MNSLVVKSHVLSVLVTNLAFASTLTHLFVKLDYKFKLRYGVVANIIIIKI